MSNSVISFFTGAGLLDLGFRAAGFEVIWHNEINPSFIKAFKYGYEKLYGITSKEINIFEGSIENVDKKLITSRTPDGILSSHNFGIIGGPPCPDFSNAGKHQGMDGENGKLTGIYIDLINTLQPNFFVLENVKGLIQRIKHRKYLAELLGKLQRKYLFDVNVLNSLNFGVPQDRERLFVVGFKKEFIFEKYGSCFVKEISIINNAFIEFLNGDLPTNTSRFNWYPWPSNPKYDNAKKKFAWPTTTLFGSTPSTPEYLPDELCLETSVFGNKLNELDNQNDIFKSYSEKFHSIDEGDISRKSFKRLHRWRFSPTAAYGNNEVHLHPYYPRRLSVREVMRIQSVPDNFSLPADMSLSSKFKTISNGVPVVLAEEIAKSLSAFISDD